MTVSGHGGLFICEHGVERIDCHVDVYCEDDTVHVPEPLPIYIGTGERSRAVADGRIYHTIPRAEYEKILAEKPGDTERVGRILRSLRISKEHP